MKFKIAVVIFVIIFIQSCIPSIHPLWTQDKLVFNENLVGEWSQSDTDHSNSWKF